MDPSGIGVCSRGCSLGGEPYCGLPGALPSDGMFCCCCPYGLTPGGGVCCCRGSVSSFGGCCGAALPPGTPFPVGGGEGRLPTKFPSFLT